MKKKNNTKLFQDLSKINYSLSRFLNTTDKPNILEFGVQLGSSTKYFLDLCKEKNGKLYSVDIDDCSKLFNEDNWNFIQSRDDNFDFLSKKIPKKVDIIYLDTIHTAKHVEKIFKYYYRYLNKYYYLTSNYLLNLNSILTFLWSISFSNPFFQPYEEKSSFSSQFAKCRCCLNIDCSN